VFSRLNGKPPSEPAAGEWPIPAGDSEQYWNSVKQSVYENANKLISSIENLPDEKLEEKIGEERYASLGTGLTVEGTVIGLIQHNAYHAGQISLLKK
ncbi:MAG: hypothetical protein AB1298_09075, partial [Bacteroidota bacterium]